MSYRMFENDKKFFVLETATDQIIRKFTSKSDAKSFMRHLNLDGGFAGWTPSFFLKEVKVKYTES